MGLKFETLGNATLQLFEDDRPVLATDPWLKGTAYFGSWGLDHPLTESQIRNVIQSPYIWISHGHPDHLHPESIEMLSRKSLIFLPNHYHPEIQESLVSKGFRVEVLKFKEWTRLTPTLRVICLENMNQDAILIIEAGDALIVNLNDSPLHGEGPFLKALIRSYKKSYLLALCSIDADMINIVGEQGKSIAPPPVTNQNEAPSGSWGIFAPISMCSISAASPRSTSMSVPIRSGPILIGSVGGTCRVIGMRPRPRSSSHSSPSI